MKRKVPFLMIITASTAITWLILLLHFTYIWPGMGWLSLSLNCPLTPNPITPSLHLSFQQLFDRKNHKKRRKAFPRSCPLKIKDSVALSPIKWMRGDIWNCKIQAEFPHFPKTTLLPSKTLFTTMWHEQKSKKKPTNITYLCASVHVPQDSRDHETLWNMCVYERDGWGCSQGYFRDLAVAS